MTFAQTSPRPMRRTLGAYQLLAELGEVGTGAVYLAKLDGLSTTRKLAILKELRADVAESCARDVALAAQITHPNVVQTYGVEEDHGRLYVATEYLDGQPWARLRRALAQRDALSESLELYVLLEVLSGLQHAHEQSPLSIVHGHVNPQSVVVTYEGLVKLIDFGVGSAVLADGKRTGALAYSAPEQVRGDAVDRRADIFVVGVMLWEAMTHRPFVESADESELRRLRVSGLEPRVRAVVPDAPPALADICDRALALAPDERFASALELRDALLEYLGNGNEGRDLTRARLSELVQSAFQSERASFSILVEQQLRPGVAPSPVPAPQPIARKVSSAPVVRKRTGLPATQRGTLALLVLAVALLSFGVTWLLARPEPEVVAPAPAPPLDPPSQPETTTSLHASRDPEHVAPPSSYRLAISARPEAAVLSLDGVPLSDNPFNARVGADGQPHTVRASGVGLATEERVVTFDRDQVLSFELKPRVARTGSAPPRAARKLQLANPVPPPTAAKPTEANGGARQRPRASDMFDAPLRVGRSPRPIYEDDPYVQQ